MTTIKVSTNVLAAFIATKSPAKKRSIVRAVKEKKGGPSHYGSFNKAARNYLLNKGTSRAEIDAVIASLIAEAALPRDRQRSKEWFQTRATLTAEAFKALETGIHLLDYGTLNFVLLPKGMKTRIQFGDVAINIRPDLLIEGNRNGVPIEGAFRFYVAKTAEYQLSKRAAELVSAMEYELLITNWKGKRTPDPSLCYVLECFQQRLTPAPADVQATRASIERGCREFSQIWHELDSHQAA